MEQPEVLEGTWEELSVHAPSFHGKKLRLTIVEDENQLETMNSEEARVAAIHAGMGKFADPTRKLLASEELRRERRRDETRMEPNLGSHPS